VGALGRALCGNQSVCRVHPIILQQKAAQAKTDASGTAPEPPPEPPKHQATVTGASPSQASTSDGFCERDLHRGRGGGGNVGPRRRGYTATQAERYHRAVSNNRRPAVVTDREALDAFKTICQFFRE